MFFLKSPLKFVLVAAIVLAHIFSVGSTFTAYAQSATATLGGTIVDEQGAVVAGANITVTDMAKAITRQTTTNDDGYFTITQLPPSTFTVRVERAGFTTRELSDVVLNVNDQSALRIALKVGQVGESVEITSDTPLIGESPAVSTVVDRQFIENQPLNGRNFQTLVELAPGVVIAPSTITNPGQFSVNGQRTGSNYFTVDGVSANFGSTASVTLYETAGGGVPAYSALGSTASLASVDAVQEFSIQTSTYAPEFGRQPGGQISLVTRSGTNEFHGSVFDYVRNDIFDANNFFANANALERPAVRQNDFGFTLGGPVFLPRFGEGGRALYNGRNRTFFFASYEGVRLRQGIVSLPLQVPSLSARAAATGVTRDLLNAFPLPTGAAFANDRRLPRSSPASRIPLRSTRRVFA